MTHRVLHIVRPVKGGIKKHLQLLFQGIDRERFTLYLAAPPDEELRHAFQPFIHAFIPVQIAEGWNPGRDWRIISKLGSVLRNEQIDLVHTHGMRAGILGQAAALLAKRPVVATIHNLPIQPGGGYDWVRPLQVLLHRQAVHHVIAVSRAIAEQAQARLLVPGKRISVVYNGIVAANYDSRQQTTVERRLLGIDTDMPVIGAVARLERRKGIRYLIETIPLVESICGQIFTVIVGDGPERHQLQILAGALGVEKRVIFTGFRDDVPGLLQLFDLAAVPSVQEGLCIFCLEALASGCPVIASAIGGLPEIIEHGKTGLLVSPADPEALAKGIIALLRDRNMAEAMASQGRAMVAERFDRDTMIRKTEAIYEKIVTECSDRSSI